MCCATRKKAFWSALVSSYEKYGSKEDHKEQKRIFKSVTPATIHAQIIQKQIHFPQKKSRGSQPRQVSHQEALINKVVQNQICLPQKNEILISSTKIQNLLFQVFQKMLLSSRSHSFLINIFSSLRMHSIIIVHNKES